MDFLADKYGKVIFYFPKKIQQVRNRITEKKTKEETIRAIKKTIKTQKKIKKKKKARILNKRRIINIYNKEVKKREKK